MRAINAQKNKMGVFEAFHRVEFVLNQGFRFILIFAILAAYSTSPSASQSRRDVDMAIAFPAIGLLPRQLAVVVNTRDALSLSIADYYQQQRHIPARNLIKLSFDPGQPVLAPATFKRLQQQLEAQLPEGIQALALTWSAPYRVGCMSITAAFSLGFHTKYCAKGCRTTATSPYADSSSHLPYDAFNIRPSMMLAGKTLADVKALIDRGVSADASTTVYPKALLVETPDKLRSVRKRFFPAIERQFAAMLDIRSLRSRDLRDFTQVMFYFTGDARVQHIRSNRFLPGAMADHLTSWGGKLINSSQMSALEWLAGGATGSYGTVLEPCNFTEKFPNPEVLIRQYLKGFSLIEAYWQSVLMPGQGVFIGEPLAAPFRYYRVKDLGSYYRLESPMLIADHYDLLIKNKHRHRYRVLLKNLPRNPYSRSLFLPKPLDIKRQYKLRVASEFEL